ncbi:MAG: hypothetical protein COV44_05105 [Deltaproteobacteria bacterium CG11_big_fil_rev_8_21_14_0_20_45_16]|nr:MAG: hypothetical protein COV44_05105 [Deltaproteobacteria bacterium CG11_big_fil_rev_8_21_14_0_20_45_16]
MKQIVFQIILFIVAAFATPTSKLTYAKEDCPSLFGSLSTLGTEVFRPSRNIFNESLPSTLVSGFAWLNAAQVIRTQLVASPTYLTPALLITAPLDLGLTIVSHYNSLAEAPGLRNLKGRAAFWARAAINTVVGTGGIVGFWALYNFLQTQGLPVGNYAINPRHCALAIGLCSIVYPSLQASKTILFKKLPALRDIQFSETLKTELPDFWKSLEETGRRRADDLNISELDDHILLGLLEYSVTRFPIENSLELQNISKDDPQLQSLLEKISSLHERSQQRAPAWKRRWHQLIRFDSNAKLESQMAKIRRQIINRLLELQERQNTTNEISNILDMGDGLSETERIRLHHIMAARMKVYSTQIVVSSIIDQFLAVMIAGGVGLYHLNHIAEGN